MKSWFPLALALALPLPAQDGKAIYAEHCANCHGDQGQGVDEEYDEALVGKKSVVSLADYIDRKMPEDEEHLVVGEDARAVAEYIHAAFYSPEAQERLRPVRRDLLRLTRYQHRNAIADLIGSFRWQFWPNEERGLKGEYTAFVPGVDTRKEEKLYEQVDAGPAFNLADHPKLAELESGEFQVRWFGTLMPKESGYYKFRTKSPNGVKLFLNEIWNEERGILIDGWVSSGNEMRTLEGGADLLGGYGVGIRVEFISFQEKESSLVVEWKPPHGVWEPIPRESLSPQGAPPLGIVSDSFPPDDASLGYERGSSVSETWRDAVVKSAIEASTLVGDQVDELAKTKPDAPDRVPRLKEFAVEFAGRAFGRPLDGEQRARYVDRLFESNEPVEAVKRSVMLVLSSPYFLYQEEGTDSFAIARRMALSLWDSLPDQQLREVAARDGLQDASERERQAWRMLNDPRCKVKLHRFFYHWLALEEKEDIGKDPAVYPDFSPELVADLRRSLDHFLESVVWSETSDYRRLFTTEELYLNDRLAAFYGISSNPGSTFAPLPAPDRQRAGLLTHPYLLAAFSYSSQTSPIHRGVYLGRNVLGRFLKPPPQAIEFKDEDFDPDLTMREKVTQLTRHSDCMACHSIINPVGFSLENFDAVGRYREEEKGRRIDTASEYPTADDRTITISGPKDLAAIALESPAAHEAFIQALFHHLRQQPVAAFGPEKMDELHKGFVSSGFNIRNLMVKIGVE